MKLNRFGIVCGSIVTAFGIYIMAGSETTEIWRYVAGCLACIGSFVGFSLYSEMFDAWIEKKGKNKQCHK